MKDERIWNLIGRQLAGEAADEELAEIDQWLRAQPEHPRLHASIREFWQNRQKTTGSDASRVWQSLTQQINAETPEASKVSLPEKPRLAWFFKVAATVTVLLLAGWLLWQYGTQTLLNLTATVQENTRGNQSEIILPDGSRVWLNAESKLTYYPNFGAGSRTVYLSGEAFFEVEKNPDIPFIIHLGAHRIQVLGTSFNVKSYEDEETVETSVITGKVMFVKKAEHAGKNDSVYYITPNLKLALFKDSGQVETMRVDSREDMAWTQGKLVFKNESWDQIARILERTYDTAITFEDPALKNCRLTATFQKKTLEEVLELIAMTQDFSYEIHPRVLIKGKGCVDAKANQ